MYDDRREAIQRQRRAPREIEAIVNNALMSPEARNLLNHLLSKPVTFQINQRYVIRRGDYGGRDKVRRLFHEMILAGHCTTDPERNPDGTFKRGIYLVSDQPKWLAPVDISEFENSSEDGQIAEGNTADPATANQSLGIDNSIVNPDTDTSRGDAEKPVSPPEPKAESRDRGSNDYMTEKGEAERRAGGAKAHLPGKEPGSRPAKGLALRGAASGAVDQTAKDRYTERLIDQMVDAASVSGSRMPSPRTAARAVASLIQWRALDFDFELDVLPAIADVCSRAGDPDKPIVSWHYFTGAIGDAHKRRTRPAAPRTSAPRRKVEGWTQAGAAFANGRRR